MRTNTQRITVQTVVQSDLDSAWEFWTKPEHIMNWNFASDEWCCPAATNDLKPGGAFRWRMELRQKKVGFDFIGTYDRIVAKKHISYHIPCKRRVDIEFIEQNQEVVIRKTFDLEEVNTNERQREGWQAILDNYKKYVESI
ncbi:SRPBCC domain-containing protein [Maribacter sp. 2307UL18-2]|uniref:SRPBCC domain-containing protein n=1 Tax=Maribacter sp. 2307UL18-2 TaxID=3386274 RepID=UPI0039BD87B2